MNSSPSVAANLSNDARKGLAILSLSKAEPIAHLADREGVSRQCLYRQKQKAAEVLDEAFAVKGDGVLTLPVFFISVSKPSLPGGRIPIVCVTQKRPFLNHARSIVSVCFQPYARPASATASEKAAMTGSDQISARRMRRAGKPSNNGGYMRRFKCSRFVRAFFCF